MADLKTSAQMREEAKNAVAVRVENSTAIDVQDGVRKALQTNAPNPYAMTFEVQSPDGKKHQAAYVRKAGRSVILNEVAKKKGGIAFMGATCVKSSKETKSDLLTILSHLPEFMSKDFMAKRGGDYRCLSYPDGDALYIYTIIFKNGEKWVNEGTAGPKNVKTEKMLPRLDELAATRAFNRTVGFGTGDGFIDPEQAAGGGDLDEAEAALMDEDEGFEDGVLDMEAGPDGSISFRAPDGGGADGTGGSAEIVAAPEEAHQGHQGSGEAVGGASPAEGDQGDGGRTGGVPVTVAERPATGHYASQAPSIDDLMGIARRKGIHLVALAKERFGKALPQLTGQQRIELQEEMIGGEIYDDTTSS